MQHWTVSGSRFFGLAHGLDTLIAPVRPTLKQRYPLTPIEHYLSWRRPDGTHSPLAENARAARRRHRQGRLRIGEGLGTVAEWEEWTEMALPESGTYVVPGALVPIEIDRERDEGVT